MTELSKPTVPQVYGELREKTAWSRPRCLIFGIIVRIQRVYMNRLVEDNAWSADKMIDVLEGDQE